MYILLIESKERRGERYSCILQSLAKPASLRVQLLEVLPRFSTMVHSPTTEACSYSTKGQKKRSSLPRQSRPAVPGSTSLRFTATATLDSMSRIVLLMHLLFDDATPPSRARLHGRIGLCPPDRARRGEQDT